MNARRASTLVAVAALAGVAFSVFRWGPSVAQFSGGGGTTEVSGSVEVTAMPEISGTVLAYPPDGGLQVTGAVSAAVTGSVISFPPDGGLRVTLGSDTVPVTGSVSASVVGTVPVSGTVGVSGTVPVTGTVSANVVGTVPISGTVSTNVIGTVPVLGAVSATVSGSVGDGIGKCPRLPAGRGHRG